ncbi:MAG: putative S-layer domain protein, partial [Solirubrobacterales bacterium]|nr:putative S-layer domain protein [Solirubrobacterales bacterium]
PKVSGDGSFVAFASMSTDLGDGDTDAIRDVHRRDINIGVGATGATVLISRATGVGGAKGDGNSGPTGISTTGARVAFTSSAASLGALGGFNYAAFVRDHAIGATTMLAAAGNVNIGMGISGDGKVAAFTANAAATPGAPPASVYVRDLAAPDPELVSQPASGPLTAVLSDADYSYYEGNPQALSADGRYVVFATRSPGLIGDANIDAAIFRRDLRTGDVVLVSRKTGATGQQAGYAAQPTISADGSKVSFVADDALDPADNNGVMDVYVRDLAASTTTLASRADTPTGAVGSGNVARQQLSADGRHVLFLENATNLGGPGEIRAYVRDLVAATTTIADRADDDTLKSDPVDSASVSGDGRLVAFASTSSDLGDGDTDNKSDIHLRDLAAQTTTLVSRADGPAGVKGDLLSVAPVISTDGTVVAFRSYAKNLDATAGPWPVGTGVMAFTRDLATGVTRLVSRAGLAGPAPVAGRVSPLALSRDGAVVSYAADGEMAHALDPAAPVDADAVVVRTRSTGAQTVVHVTARRDPTELSDPAGVTTPALSADGSCLAFSAQGLGMQPFVAADTRQWYVRVLSGSCGTVAPPAGPPVIPSPVPITPPATTAVPKVTKLSLSVRRFKVGTKRTAAIAVVKKKTTPASTTIRFTLSAAATATLAFEQRTTGRRSGTRCVQATRKLASHAKCTRYVRRLSITRKRSKAGAASVVFTGRVGTKKLAVGSYRVVVTAKNASGTSKSVTAAFTVVRR